MAGPLPLIIAGGVAIAVLGGKKKSKTGKAKNRTGKACDITKAPPKGYLCDGGVLQLAPIIDEDILETYEEASPEERGDFEIEEEDISISDQETAIQDTAMRSAQAEEIPATCEEFLEAIYVRPTDATEIPINKVAVEQTAMPVMKQTLLKVYDKLGTEGLDADVAGPQMVVDALQELVPVCKWRYDDAEFGFMFDDSPVASEIGRDVIYGLMTIAVNLIEDFQAKGIENG